MPKQETKYRAVIYPKVKKIACVLLQAVYGGSTVVPHWFDDDLWAVAPPKERPIAVAATRQEWEALAKKWKKESNRLDFFKTKPKNKGA